MFRNARCSSFAVATIAGALSISACDQGADPKGHEPRAGDLLVGEYGVGDRVVERTTYRIEDLEEAGTSDGTALAQFVVKREVLVPDLAPRHAAEPVTIAEVRAFLRDEWDAYVGGEADAGHNARELAAAVNDVGLDLTTFMRAYEKSGCELERFVGIGNEVSALQDVHGRHAFGRLLEALDDISQMLVDFDANASTNGGTALAANALLGGTALPGEDEDGGILKAGVEFLRLGWEVIKDNEPVTDVTGASTFVLNPKDDNALDYVGATDFQTEKQWWIVKDAYGIDMTSASWHVKGTKNATNAAFGGWYLPSVYVSFDNVSAMFGNTLKGSATITSITNAGTADAPNPSFKVLVDLTSHHILDSDQQSFESKVSGKL